MKLQENTYHRTSQIDELFFFVYDIVGKLQARWVGSGWSPARA